MSNVDQLARIIRKVDGDHKLGAATLAESIINHPDFRILAKEVSDRREPVTTKEVALLYKVNVATVQGWIRSGKLKAAKAGRSYTVKPSWLDAFEKSRTTVTSAH